MNVVITGTSRGIGRELLNLAVQRGDQVLAVQRGPAANPGARVKVLNLDVTDANVGPKIVAALDGWTAVDVLINDAGIYRTGAEPEDFLDSIRVNAVAPFVITRALKPWLRKSQNPRAVQVTSKMGSINDNTSGGHYAYRASKTALNMINKSLAVDEPWLTTTVIHPGWVQTDMGGNAAPLPTKDSAKGIWAVIDHLTRAHSGQFVDYRGERIAW